MKLLFLCLLAAPAFASPYGPWAAEMSRAVERGQEAMLEHARAAPAFARTWAYGHLADVVDERVPAAERQVWRSRLEALAGSVDADLGFLLKAPELKAQVEAAIPLAERLQDHLRAGASIAVWVAVAEEGWAAKIAFYSQLFRAGLTLGRPTEPERVEAMLALARHLAAGRAVVFGGMDWHKDLAAWHGATGVPLAAAGDELTGLLNVWLADDARAVLAHGDRALREAERKGEGLRTVLIQHLGASIAEKAGRKEAGRNVRIEVLQAVRPLGKPRLTGAILAGVLWATEGAALVPFVDEFIALELPAALPWRYVALKNSYDRLQTAQITARDLGIYDARVRVADALGLPSRWADRVAAVESRLQRGRHDEVQALVEQAEAAAGRVSDEAEKRIASELLEILRDAGLKARFILGDVAGALAGAQARPAAHRRLLAQIRLAEGRPAAAFAHANAGLHALRGMQAAQERSALHAIAATALHAAGFEAAAIERARWARQHPIALLDPAARSGCAQAPQPTPEVLTCRAAAQLAAGQLQEAEKSLNYLRKDPLLDPAVRWRSLALAAEVAALKGKAVEAAGLARQAVLGWLDLGAERPIAGYTIDLQGLSLPESGHDTLATLPDRLVEAARQDKEGAAAHQRAALAAALLARRLAVAPHFIITPVPSAGEAALRTPLARLGALRHHPEQATRLTRALDDARTARQRFALENPPRAAWLYPTLPEPNTLLPPPGEARLYFHFGPRNGHLWLALPGEALRHYDLPNAAAVETLLAPARALLAEPQKAFESAPLQAPVPVLLPFLAELGQKLTGLEWSIITDGPLDTFPLAALVLEDRADGGPPVFLAARHPLRHALFLGPTPALTPPPGLAVIGEDRPESQALVAAGAGRAVLAAPTTLADRFEVHGRLIITARVEPSATLGEGPGGSDTVVLLQPPAELRPLTAALHHRGVKSLIFLNNHRPDDAAFAAALTTRLAAGEAPAAALAALQEAARTTADPATWHPARWARWIHLESLAAK